jgi:hypothetical protein
LTYAVSDLDSYGPGKLSEFLREVALDIVGGRSAFRPLTSIFASLSHGVDGLRNAYVLLESELSNETAATLKDHLAAEVLTSLPESAALFSSTLKYWTDLSANTKAMASTTYREAASRALAHLGPPVVFRCLREPDERNELALRAVKALSLDSLLDYLNVEPDAFATALEHQPGLLALPELWSSSSRVRRIALSWIRDNSSAVELALPSLLRADSGDFADEIRRQVGSHAILGVLLQLATADQCEDFGFADHRWIAAAIEDKNKVASVLAETRGLHRKPLIAIARAVSPDVVPNDYGEDPWLTAVKSTPGTASPKGEIFLKAFLFARALGYRSRNQAELFVMSFQDLHTAALQSAIPDDAWKLFSQRLPNSYYKTWDRAESLRRAVVDAFVGRRLNTFSFSNLSGDELFEDLVQIAASTYSGRRYLSTVKLYLGGDTTLSKQMTLERALEQDS